MHREDFDIFDTGIIFFDNASTTMKPKNVVKEITDYYTKYTSNIHRGDYDNSVIVDTKYDEVREKSGMMAFIPNGKMYDVGNVKAYQNTFIEKIKE